MGRKRIDRRTLLKATGATVGAAGIGTYVAPGGLSAYAGSRVDPPLGLGSALVGAPDERARTPPSFGPHDRPNAAPGDPGRADPDAASAPHDVYVVCHRHSATDPDRYGAVVETLRAAADYHSSWREFSVAVVDAGADLPDGTPAFDAEAIYEYARGHQGPYSSRHDVHLLVFDNPWFRVGRAAGKVGWDVGREPWAVAVLAAGLAATQSEPYMRSMALHEVGHTLIRKQDASGGYVDGHEAGGVVRDDGVIETVYPMSSTYVFDGDGGCDVAGIACRDDGDAPGEFVGCTDNRAGEGFADPLYRNLFWSNPRTHDGTPCRVSDPRPGDESPGFTEDEIALTVRERLR